MASRPDNPIIPLPVTRRFSTAPFMSWEYEDVIREVNAHVPQESFRILKAYAVEHDHFQDGKEWVGPGVASVNEKIKTQFAPEDVVGEALTNVENAFSEPQLGAVPIKDFPEGQAIPQETQNKIREALTFLTVWWDNQRLQEKILDRIYTSAWASYAGMRLWIPGRFLDVTTVGDVRNISIRSTDDIEEALSFIHVMNPLPDKGCLLVDVGTQDKVAVYLDEEVVYIPREGAAPEKKTYKRAELIFLDPDRQNDEDADTIIRIVYSDKTKPTLQSKLKLGGRLLFSEMQTRSLLTDPVIRTQRQVNLLATLITRIGETAAFRERYMKNARPQGLRIPYDEGDPLGDGAFIEKDDDGRLWQVVPQARTLGANTTTELVGLQQFDKEGDIKGNQMPDVTIVDPVDPKPYAEAADAARRRILRMCGQGHLGGISNAEASGIAYEQARAVFEKDLNKRRVTEEGMLRDLLTAVLSLAEIIAGQQGYFTDVIRITVDQHIDAGPRSPDLVRLDLESHEAGALSLPTLMSRLGVEDIEAEMVRIRRSAAFILDVLEKATPATEVFTTESIIEVMRQLNIPKEIIDQLKVKEIVTPPTPATEE